MYMSKKKLVNAIKLAELLIGYLPFFHGCLITLYKMFIKPHFKYADIMYDKPNNELFQKKN